MLSSVPSTSCKGQEVEKLSAETKSRAHTKRSSAIPHVRIECKHADKFNCPTFTESQFYDLGQLLCGIFVSLKVAYESVKGTQEVEQLARAGQARHAAMCPFVHIYCTG
jgi:hypothetical protein